jgi:hypothetical protein
MKDGWFGQRKRDEMRGIRPDFSGVSLPAIKLFRNFLREKTWGYREEKLVSGGSG